MKKTTISVISKMFRIVMFSALLFTLPMCTPDKQENNRPSKKILFVNSFNNHHLYSSRLLAEFKSTLDNSLYDTEILEVNLSGKNISDIEAKRDILHSTIKSLKGNFDIIASTDYDAAQLLLCGNDSIIPNVPIVSVTMMDSLVAPVGNKICIHSMLRIDDTFITARKMLPNAQKAYMICDSTTTGLQIMKIAHIYLDSYRHNFDIQFGISAKDDNELLQKLSKLEPNSFVILGTWQRGDNGEYYKPEKLYPRIAKASNAPIFSVVDNMTANGIIGGYLENPVNNGKALASTVIDVFNGKIPARNLQVNATPIFNSDAMSKWDLSRRLIPIDSIRLNDFSYLITQNSKTISFVVLLLLLIIITLYLCSRLYKKNIILKRQNLINSVKVKNLSADSNLFNLYIHSLDIYMWVLNTDTQEIKYVDGSELTISLDDFCNRIIALDKHKFMQSLLKCSSGRSDNFKCVYRYRRNDGEEHQWWESRGIASERCDSSGKIYKAITGLSLNVTSYKETEKTLTTKFESSKQVNAFRSNFYTALRRDSKKLLKNIIADSERISKTENTANCHELSKAIIDKSNLLLNAINDTLIILQLEYESLTLNIEKFDFSNLFTKISKTAKSAIIPPIELHIKNSVENCIINSDITYLENVINKLIYLSKKSISSGYIEISAKIVDNTLLFTISSNGEYSESILVSNQATIDEIDAGLYIAQELIRKIGGTLHYETSSNNISTYRISINIINNKHT